jgi:hypothetical protein
MIDRICSRVNTIQSMIETDTTKELIDSKININNQTNKQDKQKQKTINKLINKLINELINKYINQYNTPIKIYIYSPINTGEAYVSDLSLASWGYNSLL